MDLFGKFRKLDSSLQRGLDNGFARVFGGEVVPVEIDESLKQQTETSVMMDRDGNHWAPCYFVVNISQRDYDSLHANYQDVEADLSDRLQRFIRNSGWRTNSPVQVIIEPQEGMHSGQLKADSMFNAPAAGSRRQVTPGNQVGHVSKEDDAALADSADHEDESGYDNSYNSEFESQQGYANQGYAEDRPSASATPQAATPAAASPGLSDIVQPAPGSQQQWNNQVEQDQEWDGPEVASEKSHPGESAYAANSNNGTPSGPFSYPGTEVLTQNLHKEDPRSGASADRHESQAEVTLILRDGSDRRYVLHEGSNVIGRGNGVDLRIPDTGVSRQHAEITWDGYDAVLTDLQSTNGTSVNETPIENWLLADGDLISLGHSEIEVQFR